MTFRRKGDAYGDVKKYHMADKMTGDGRVSALCFQTPRAINLRNALWTLRKDAVTCAGCLRRLRAALQGGPRNAA